MGEDPNTIEETVLNYKVYPNPVINNLNIEVQGNVHIQIYSLKGSLLFEHLITNSYNLDLSQYDSGIYILSLTNKTSRGSIKLVKI